MDQERILKYLLQVGRSYYTSDDFRRSYAFVPTSRFGIGFLSVFAVSDEVTVDTLAAGAAPGEGLRLTLTGPRNYVLTERSNRTEPGTRIEIVLRSSGSAGNLHDVVNATCRRVEFPITVTDEETVSEIRSETSADFTYELTDASEDGVRMGIRSFPVLENGLFGELYVFYRVDASGAESWVSAPWSQQTYPSLTPLATAPPLPASLTCVHGVTYAPGKSWEDRNGFAARIDYRKPIESMSLSRSAVASVGPARLGMDDPGVRRALERIVTDHLRDTPLAAGPESWKYRQQLMSLVDLPAIWTSASSTLRLFRSGGEETASIAELSAQPTISVIVRRPVLLFPDDEPALLPPSWSSADAVLSAVDLRGMSKFAREALFRGRTPTSAEQVDTDSYKIDWQETAADRRLINMRGQVADAVSLPVELVGLRIHRAADEVYDHALLNADHPFVRWLEHLHEACDERRGGLSPATWAAVSKLLASPLWYRGHNIDELNTYLRNWPEVAGVDSPPVSELDPRWFL